MSYELYCPTSFETPKPYKKNTKNFGMGIRKAKDFVENLNQSKIDSPILIYGSAGALDPQLQPGDFFLIHEIYFEDQNYQINTSDLDIPKAKLFTSRSLLKTKKEKQVAYKNTGASLVDMEMGAIWKYASEDLKKHLIFIRIVIDHAEQDFPNFYKLSVFRDIYSLVKNWRSYLRETERVLDGFKT